MGVAEEVGSEFIVAGGEATAVLQAAEPALDGVAALVEGVAEAALPTTVAFRRDVGDRALILDQISDADAVVGAVGMDDATPGQGCKQMLGSPAVRRLPRRQQEGERSALPFGDSMGLGVAAAPADADRLNVRAPFSPAAE